MEPFGRRIQVEFSKVDSPFKTLNDGKIQTQGTVIAIGDGCTWAKVGDEIVFNYWGYDGANVNGKEVITILEDEEYLIGKIKNGEVSKK